MILRSSEHTAKAHCIRANERGLVCRKNFDPVLQPGRSLAVPKSWRAWRSFAKLVELIEIFSRQLEARGQAHLCATRRRLLRSGRGYFWMPNHREKMFRGDSVHHRVCPGEY